ncbi:zinc-ribbon domain-containing protein [bacterium]|nr:zinc-ribbon domain-containing protein [bacterium]
MFCSNCGKEIDDNSKYCPYCGAINEFDGTTSTKTVVEENNDKRYERFRDYENAEYFNETPTIGILALVFSILGGYLGLIFGIIGLVKYKQPKNRRRCTAAIVIFVVWLFISILLANI